MAGESKAKVIPLHGNSSAAARRAGERAAAARRHPSLFTDADTAFTDEQVSAVVHEFDQHRGAPVTENDEPNELAQRVSAISEFLRKRLTGDYIVDEFGFDPDLNNAVFLPILRTLFRNWFRVEVSGIENLPVDGAALIVANHAGVLPFDGLMTSVAVHDHHPTNRDLRLLAADLVFDMPMVGQAARKAGLVSLPGILSPTEAFAAIGAGANALKLFPMEMIGVAGVKAMRAVLPRDLRLVAVGGVGPTNMREFHAAGCSGFGLGSSLFRPGVPMATLRALAEAAVGAVRSL